MTLKRDKILTGIALLVVGILFMVAPMTTTRLIYGAIGIVLILAGISRLVLWIRIKEAGFLKTFNLILAILLTILGIFFLVAPEFFIAYAYIVFGILLAVNGALNIVGVMQGTIQPQGGKWMYLILSVLLFIAGIVVIVHPFAMANTVTSLIGIMLIAGGLINLWIALRIATME